MRMGALTAGELEWALQEQKADGRRLGEILLAHGKVTGEQMALKRLARQIVNMMEAPW